MPPKKGAQSDKFSFTQEMDEFTLDALLYQASIGQRPSGTFTAAAYNSVLGELKSKFSDVPWCKEKFRNRVKYIKKHFAECYDIFKNVSKSGWGFNPNTKMWELEDEVWDELIKVNPKAKDWRGKQMPLYEKLQELFGKDRATDDNAVTAGEIRARRKVGAQKQGQLIKEIDQLISQNEAEIEGFGTRETSPTTPIIDPVADETELNVSQQGRNNGKGSRRKRKMDAFLEACNEMLSANIDKVISANKPLDPNNVLKCLEDIDFDERFKRKAYFHLSRNPMDFEILIALPLAERGSALWDILVEAQIISNLEPSPYDI